MKVAETFLRFAGRRKGRPLHQGRADALKQIDDFVLLKNLMEKSALDPQDFFAEKQDKLWLEIGFGNGEHLTGQAQRHSDIGFIGCEPFINGVSAAAKDIMDHTINNVRIWPDEALAFLEKFPDACINGIFLLLSDPWPKTKQYKRRVIQTATVDLFSRLLKPGGESRQYCCTAHR